MDGVQVLLSILDVVDDTKLVNKVCPYTKLTLLFFATIWVVLPLLAILLFKCTFSYFKFLTDNCEGGLERTEGSDIAQGMP